MRNIQLGNHWVGDQHPCFITFEAGPTHSGLESAIKLVHLASEAGANAIKFQIFSADKLVKDKEQLFEYQILLNKELDSRKSVSEPLYNILKRRELKPSEWAQVKEVADSLNLAFFATIGYEEDISLLNQLNVDSIKIASADVNHFPLLRLAAKSGMNVQLDTGNSELAEIESAVNFLQKEGCSSVIIHQCPSGYPAHLPSIHLNMIKALRERFPLIPIAYSDHTPDADMDIAALAMGVNLIEKTITLDRCTPSVEHIFSLDPEDMFKFVSRIRDIEVAFGNFSRQLTDEQKRKRNLLRRGAYLKHTVKPGQRVLLSDFDFRRPCQGISADRLLYLIELGSRYNQSIAKNTCLCEENIQRL